MKSYNPKSEEHYMGEYKIRSHRKKKDYLINGLIFSTFALTAGIMAYNLFLIYDDSKLNRHLSLPDKVREYDSNKDGFIDTLEAQGLVKRLLSER
jgi:hypothetical protein